MKKITIILASAIALCSCNEDVLQIQDSTPQEYTIRLNPVGDISAHYSPLTKAGSVNDTIWYGINIKRDNKDYLFGLYDDITKFDVKMSADHNYSFEISAVKGNSHPLCILDSTRVSTYIDEDGITHYSEWFYIYSVAFPFSDNRVIDFSYNYQTILFKRGNKVPVVNQLIYELEYNSYTNRSYCSLSHDLIWRQFKNLSIGKNSNEWYRFYGTKTNFTPSHDETLQFTMKHEGFGLQYNVTGICDGSVSVVIDNNLENNDKVTYFSQPAITGNFTSPQKVIEFRDMTAETEQVKVSVVWTRGNNVVDDLGSTIVNVRRNKVNKINITLGEHSNSKAMMVTTDASDYFGVENKEINI